MENLNADSFWDTDLEKLEATFLPKGKKITDLETTFDKRVPTQGSVILNRTINIDELVKTPSFIDRLKRHIIK